MNKISCCYINLVAKEERIGLESKQTRASALSGSRYEQNHLLLYKPRFNSRKNRFRVKTKCLLLTFNFARGLKKPPSYYIKIEHLTSTGFKISKLRVKTRILPQPTKLLTAHSHRIDVLF